MNVIKISGKAGAGKTWTLHAVANKAALEGKKVLSISLDQVASAEQLVRVAADYFSAGASRPERVVVVDDVLDEAAAAAVEAAFRDRSLSGGLVMTDWLVIGVQA